MMTIKVLNVLIGCASFAFVLVIAWQMRRYRVPANRALIALAVVFALRTTTRSLPPFGEDTPLAVGIFDVLLLAAMLVLVIDSRRIVQAFAAQRQAAERAQLDYDHALHEYERQVQSDLEVRLHAIEREALDALDRGGSEREALERVAGSLAELRSER